MNILMLAPQPFYAERGTPMNVRLMCRILGEAGHAVDLVVFPTGTDIELENVRIIRLPNLLGVRSIPVGPSLAKLFYDVVLTCLLPFLCLRKRYRVIHGIEEAGFLAVIFAAIFRTASIFDMDSSMSEQLAESGFVKNKLLLSLAQCFESWAINKSSLVITVCEALSNRARSLAPRAKIVQIEDIPLTGCESTEQEEQNVAGLLAAKGLTDCTFMLYTGNLEKYQGIDLLIRAWAVLRNRQDAEQTQALVIVGGAPEQVTRYEQMCRDAGIAGSVFFIGARPAREMDAWMCRAAALVSPRSEGENTPLKIYTYMAAGKPLLATDRKTHTQVLHDEVAFLAEPEAEPFAEKIAEIFTDKNLAAQKAAAAARLVEEKYSYRVFREKLLAAYELEL